MQSKFFVSIFLFSAIVFAQNNIEHLQSSIEQILNDGFFNQSQVAIDIYDLTNQQPLYSKNSSLLFNPASNLKLFTTAAGLLFLPEDFHFTTRVQYTGIVKRDTLYGDLYIVGGLDPAFSLDDLDSLVTMIKQTGIQYISGNIFTDISIKDSLYRGKGWMWDDDPDPTAPYLSALNINDNLVEIFVSAEKTDTIPAVLLNPNTDYLSVENNAAISSSGKTDLRITRNWVDQTNNIIVEGVVKSGWVADSSDHKEKLNILKPEMYFLTLLKERLIAEGIFVNGAIGIKRLPGESRFITSINRAIDSTFISDINKESDNLGAEMLLYALALNDSGAPAIALNGVEVLNTLIDTMGFNRDDYSFADGSGVSRYNLVSTGLIIGLLKFMYQQEQFDLFYNSLAIAGIDGTLEKRMKDNYAENNVHAKTGTLAGVSALSGYITAKNGNLVAFSIIMQNFVVKTSVAREIQDKICELLANYE